MPPQLQVINSERPRTIADALAAGLGGYAASQAKSPDMMLKLEEAQSGNALKKAQIDALGSYREQTLRQGDAKIGQRDRIADLADALKKAQIEINQKTADARVQQTADAMATRQAEERRKTVVDMTDPDLSEQDKAARAQAFGVPQLTPASNGFLGLGKFVPGMRTAPTYDLSGLGQTAGVPTKQKSKYQVVQVGE